MNREILFKAKRIDNGEWVEGQYAYITNPLTEDGKPIKHLICNGTNIFNDLIDPDTLCQYTGLTDKNGRKIWENDILKGYQYPYMYDGNDNYYAEVTWFENCPSFGIYTLKNPKSNVCGISEGNTEFMESWISEDWEIIGNIFDNPELLEVR